MLGITLCFHSTGHTEGNSFILPYNGLFVSLNAQVFARYFCTYFFPSTFVDVRLMEFLAKFSIKFFIKTSLMPKHTPHLSPTSNLNKLNFSHIKNQIISHLTFCPCLRMVEILMMRRWGMTTFVCNDCLSEPSLE